MTFSDLYTGSFFRFGYGDGTAGAAVFEKVSESVAMRLDSGRHLAVNAWEPVFHVDPEVGLIETFDPEAGK